MKRILITGSEGLIGWHLQCHLFAAPNLEASTANRKQFNDSEWLEKAVQHADAVVHLVGVNRGTDAEVEFDNPKLAQRLVDACEKTNSTPHVLYSNSTHCDRDIPYGRGKSTAAKIFQAWADANGALFSNMVLPHVFGEHGKPLYNSVVSTFASQLANDEPSSIQGDGKLSLMHTSQVAKLVCDLTESGHSGEARPAGFDISVADLYNRLKRVCDRYQSGVLPKLDEPLDYQLFNTYRSYLPPEKRRIPFQLHTDNRGSLFETVRADGKGQVFLSTTHPGITRGNHFHFRKVERFVVIEGRADIRLRRMFTNEVITYHVFGDAPEAIDIPTLHTHNITNTGDAPLVTLFWAGEFFDPNDPDTYACDVAARASRASSDGQE
ncbi:NAD dependent epimerase/dehydratase family protein [Planctomycetes bacterium CA13]|uniref:NAD dependent epimerase/dehydratase family protein n=1 Tax=Novipirellula herctigrandis TaxID=2527986 RepID=A0A5C5Z0L8_9BACT|nr:NAD dependent epimerase/dehydratase family protein [Planctomycetes bacterium CA13]